MCDQYMTCSFDKAQYLIGEAVRIEMPYDASLILAKVYCLEAEVEGVTSVEENTLVITGLPAGGYGILITTDKGVWEGAFDIVADHRAVTRYAFLADFSTDDAGTDDVEWLKDLHLNAVQFYDWMYRHDRLLPPKQRYNDPMGRHMDLGVISEKITKCKDLGMRPIAYGAVYAATKDTFEDHPEWGMYTMDGQPMTFANWLYYMNISKENGWADHILGEYKKAIIFGFSGIHMDTYGFPKRVWDKNGHTVDLANEFTGLINRAAEIARMEDKNGGVIFNAVNNWPMEAVAKSEQDCVYIEVWPPHDTYQDLYTLVREARICSGKNVVLAAYLKPFQFGDVVAAERAFRLAWAVICASGGTQLVLGEYESLLQDSYYVNYAKLKREFLLVVQKNCDFLVRYGDLLYNDSGLDISKTASGGINEDICFESENCDFSTDGKEDTVWTIIRESEKRVTFHLINLKGNNSLWNEGKKEPQCAEGIRVKLRLDRPVRAFYMASPDGDSLQAEELEYTYRQTNEGRIYSVDLPDVQYWTAIWAQLEG